MVSGHGGMGWGWTWGISEVFSDLCGSNTQQSSLPYGHAGPAPKKDGGKAPSVLAFPTDRLQAVRF